MKTEIAIEDHQHYIYPFHCKEKVFAKPQNPVKHGVMTDSTQPPSD
jgi:hypothetical protein